MYLKSGRPGRAAKRFKAIAGMGPNPSETLRRGPLGVTGAFNTRASHDLHAFGELLRVENENAAGGPVESFPHPNHWFSQTSLVRFVSSAFSWADVPKIVGNPPEVLFAGRNNAGKSTLIRSMTNAKGLVKTSQKPGSTQSLNFFRVGPKTMDDSNILCLVDGAGYGARGTEENGKLFEQYVMERETLKHIFVLFNLEDPINRYDEAMLSHLTTLLKNHPRGVTMQPVFTKLDKIMAKVAAKKIIKARDQIYTLAPEMVAPWLLVRAGGKPAEWVGMREMQEAALLGAGLSRTRLKPVPKVFQGVENLALREQETIREVTLVKSSGAVGSDEALGAEGIETSKPDTPRNKTPTQRQSSDKSGGRPVSQHDTSPTLEASAPPSSLGHSSLGHSDPSSRGWPTPKPRGQPPSHSASRPDKRTRAVAENVPLRPAHHRPQPPDSLKDRALAPHLQPPKTEQPLPDT